MNDIQDPRKDRLYELLPTIYRMRDAEQGYPLQALLRVIAEQVNLVEDDIRQLYENWFIETCEDWAVPYIGELVGYTPVHEAGEPSAVDTQQRRQLNKILIPRREVANTIRYRRQKGTLALLELLANDIAGWPARAVEFRNLLARTQSVKQLRMESGRTVDIHKGAVLELLGDEAARTVDVRRINSYHSKGRHNIPSVGVFVWRLKSYPVTRTPACCIKNNKPWFTFSVLGHDTPLYLNPKPETDPTHIAEECNLPVPIRRRLLADDIRKGNDSMLYGDKKSLHIWLGKEIGRGKQKKTVYQEVCQKDLVVADLSDWRYVPSSDQVAVDPELGRIALSDTRCKDVLVSYHFGFSMDIGGGEYERVLEQPEKAAIYQVGSQYETIEAAIAAWSDKADAGNPDEHAVIEIMNNGIYSEPLNIEFRKGQKSLQIRAKKNCRPIIYPVDKNNRLDALTVIGAGGNSLTLEGVLISGLGLQVDGQLAELTIRHSTLVPGRTANSKDEIQQAAEQSSDSYLPSLEIFSPNVSVKIERSILGAIQVSPSWSEQEDEKNVPNQNADSGDAVQQVRCQGMGGKDVRFEPIRIRIEDSIVDGVDEDAEVIGASGCSVAYAVLTVLRSTLIGQVQVHAVELGENSIFLGSMTVARRQIGCLRFCYMKPESSRTPQRYNCQPDLVKAAAKDCSLNEEHEAARVRPKFNSLNYGEPTYCQLADYCADEITGGADDESEMGVFHDLYQPQRMANLRVRLDEYLPARMDIGIITSN